MQLLKKILNISLSIIVSLLLIFSTWTIVDRATNYSFPFINLRFANIISPSMSTIHQNNEEYLSESEQYQVNDVVICIAKVKKEKLKEKDVILYLQNDKLICHRIVKIDFVNNDYLYTCKGDANINYDTPITYNQIKGKVIGKIPAIGKGITFISSEYGLLSIGIVGIIYVTSKIIIEKIEKKDEKEK